MVLGSFKKKKKKLAQSPWVRYGRPHFHISFMEKSHRTFIPLIYITYLFQEFSIP